MLGHVLTKGTKTKTYLVHVASFISISPHAHVCFSSVIYESYIVDFWLLKQRRFGFVGGPNSWAVTRGMACLVAEKMTTPFSFLFLKEGVS